MENSPGSRRAIYAQPQEIARLSSDETENVEATAHALESAGRIILTGTGTSFHAAALGAWQLRAVGMEAWAVSSYDLSHASVPARASDLIVVVSHRGTKRFSREIAERASAPTVVITGEGSPLRGSVTTLHTVPQETSSMHTVSFTSAIFLLLRIASACATHQDRSDAGALQQAVAEAPEVLSRALSHSGAIRAVTANMEDHGRPLWLVGPGPLRIIAREGALKCKEGAYARAEGFGSEEFLHGPYVALQPGDQLVQIGQGDRAEDVLRIADGIGVHRFAIEDPRPKGPVILRALATVVPVQLLALELATLWNVDADSFRSGEEPFRKLEDQLTL